MFIHTMLLVGENIGQCPFQPFLQRVLANLAICFNTDSATKRQAAIRMHKQFQRIIKFFPDQRIQCINFFMGFVHVQVPGNGKMAIHMQAAAVFYYTQIVHVNPVDMPV